MKNAKKNVAGFKSVFYGEKKGSNRKVVQPICVEQRFDLPPSIGLKPFWKCVKFAKT